MLFHWLLSIVTPWASVSLAEDELSIRDPVLQEALDAIDIEESGPRKRKRSSGNNKYSAEVRAQVAKDALTIGATEAARRWSSRLEKNISESTVRGWVKKLRQVQSEDPVEKIENAKMGRPYKIPDDVDARTPSSSYTMAPRGARQVNGEGKDDKRGITMLLASTINGRLLPPQVIYTGTTERCHPHYSFPEDWNITQTPSHWSNTESMHEYLQKVTPWRLYLPRLHRVGLQRAGIFPRSPCSSRN